MRKRPALHPQAVTLYFLLTENGSLNRAIQVVQPVHKPFRQQRKSEGAYQERRDKNQYSRPHIPHEKHAGTEQEHDKRRYPEEQAGVGEQERTE